MDLDKILSVYKSKTCIISVERFPDGRYGNIRIAAGNKAHCDDMMNVMHRPFIPDSPYAEYLPENKNFEDFCCRCAFNGQPLHSYVSLPQMGLWLNMFLLPLESDKENIAYCIYSYDVTPAVDSEQRATLSADTSAAVLQTCIKLRGANNTRQTFSEVIKDIRKICDSEYCCILLVDENERRCTNLCESFRDEAAADSIDNYINSGFYEIAETWKDTIGDSTCIIIKDQDDMKWLESVNPVWYKSLNGAGVDSIVVFPLNYNGSLLGYMFASDFNVDNTVKIKETLELSTYFIASEISNYQLLKRLEVLSSIDILTGVKNRNTMNNTVDAIKSGKKRMKSPCAVLFVDLNGLKQVNDVNGHSAGDQLLKTAAAILHGVFYDSEIYRAGGDEFMIISENADKDEMSARLKRLREQSASAENVHFAVGVCFVEGDMDILKAMRIADERMYEDKKEYYLNNPERKYR